MAVVVHYPPRPVSVKASESSVFLAGPIQGAPDWQNQLIGKITTELGSKQLVNIFNPRRGSLDDDFNYQIQTDWEKAGLKQAARNGVIVFWFAKQDPKEPYPKGRSYAQTSRIEFGRIFGWKDHNQKIQIVIGIEPGYIGSEKYFKTCAGEYNMPVFSSLEEVSEEVLRLTEAGVGQR